MCGADGGFVKCRLPLLYLAIPVAIESAIGTKDATLEQCFSFVSCAVCSCSRYHTIVNV